MSHELELSVAPDAHGREVHTMHALHRIQDALRGLRFGEITVIVQDGVVIQIERTEKLRLMRRDRER